MSRSHQHAGATPYHPTHHATVSFVSPPPTRDSGGGAGGSRNGSADGGTVRSDRSRNSSASTGSARRTRGGNAGGGGSGSGRRNSASLLHSSAGSAFTPQRLDPGAIAATGRSAEGSVSSSRSVSGWLVGGGAGLHRRPTSQASAAFAPAASSAGAATSHAEFRERISRLTSSAGSGRGPSTPSVGAEAEEEAEPASTSQGLLMLQPPSQTLQASLNGLAATTAGQLEEVWDEVGYSPDDRAAQLTDLLGSFRSLCEDKVAEERGVAETFRAEIRGAREELIDLARRLRREAELPPEVLHEREEKQEVEGRGRAAGTSTLTDELAALEAVLDGFRSRAGEVRSDLEECRDRMASCHAFLGTELGEEWSDVGGDLTEGRREAFRSRVADVEGMVEARTAAVVGLLKDCQHLLLELRIVDEDGGGRGEGGGTAAAAALDRQIMGSLARDPVKDAIVLTSLTEAEDCTGISSKALDALTSRVAELNGEKRRRKARLGEMGAEIASLWEKLHVAEEEQRAFADSVRGLGMDTLGKGEAELSRLHELKARMMGRLVADARAEIGMLWEATSAPEAQRAAFKAFAVTDEAGFTEDLLSEHDSYIRHLRKKYEQMQPILTVIERREAILRERDEYEEAQRDPARLQQRGAALTKQLMREEKIARRIKKELPKATEFLERKLKAWGKNRGNDPFIYQGEVYLDVMRRQEKEWRLQKDMEMRAKQQKKQQENEAASNRILQDSGYYAKPLPGKKKGFSGGGGATGPFSDAGSRANSSRGRAASRGRERSGGNPGLSKGLSDKARASSRSRPVSRGRMGMEASSMR